MPDTHLRVLLAGPTKSRSVQQKAGLQMNRHI